MAGETTGRPRGRLASALAHPAALIALTAVLTGLLVPWITYKWEERDKKVAAQQAMEERKLDQQRAAAEKDLDRQRKADAQELAVKSAILNDIANSTATFLSAIDVGTIERSKLKKAREEYRSMREATVEIASQLAAYFPAPSHLSARCRKKYCGSLVQILWQDLSYNLRNAYLLLTAPDGQPRTGWLNGLHQYLDQGRLTNTVLCSETESSSFKAARRRMVLALQKNGADPRERDRGQPLIADRNTRPRPPRSPQEFQAWREPLWLEDV